MTDLRKAINAVIKEWEHLLSEDASGTDGFAQWALNSNIEALRQALQAEPEPVAWINVERRRLEWNGGIGGIRWETPTIIKMDKIPLYTAPPSIDALIAEIESVVKCAEAATDGDTGDTIYIGEAYPEDDIKAILDKYRSKP